MVMRRIVVVTAGLILGQLCLPALGQASPRPAGMFRISGTLVNSLNGAPIARGRVTLQDARNLQKSDSSITSDDGHFDFTQVPPGKYALNGSKRGFMTGGYEQHEQYSTAIVTGAGIDTEHLVLRLSPFAVLSGKVLDEAGDPVRHGTVTLYVEDHGAGFGRIRQGRSEQTDDQGGYEFSNLRPGTFFIAVKATPWYAVHPASFDEHGQRTTTPSVDQSLDVAYPVTYYKDAMEPDEASPIPVRGGDRLEADIHLSPVPALHLLLHVPGDGQRGFAMPVLQKPSFDGMEYVPVNGGGMVSPGVFEITGVPAGRYTVNMPANPGSGSTQSSEVEMDLTGDGEELDSSKGEPTSSIKATVSMLGDEKLPGSLTILLRNSKMRIVAGQNVNEKGQIEFEDLSPGKYEFIVRAADKAYSVLRISSAGKQVSGHVLELAAGSSLSVSLTVVGSAMRVEGFAKRGDKPAPAAMVVLVPKDPETNRDLFRRDQSDLDGSFNLLGVIPGAYTVCAIQDGWDLDWAKPAVISHYCEHGTKVVVSEHPQGVMQLSTAVEVQAK
jgi:hypothetical protein